MIHIHLKLKLNHCQSAISKLGELPKADILVYAVPHKFYEKNHKSFISITREDSYIVDLKSSLDKDFFLQKKRKVWSL